MSSAERRTGGGVSALKESRCYGLSSSKLNRGGNVSVFHVKLTDSAARAIGTFQNGKTWSSNPTICFNGSQGRMTIPCSENQEDFKSFTFCVTNVARDNPQGSFDCIQQLTSGTAEELSCLGVIQKKMTVNATDDSYDKARQSMAQAEEETRSRGAIVIKHGGRYQGKKVMVRPPGPALASLAKPKNSSPFLLSNTKKGAGMSKLKKGVGTSHRKSVSDVMERPLRERVTHLLALRPYKRPELILRLQKDGLNVGDKDMLDTVLMEVGQLNSKDNTYVLKDSFYKELHKDWPGYTLGDQQLLKRILVRRLFQPQQNLLAVPEAQVSPLRDTPNSSPAHRPKLSTPEEYTDPLANKKPRISHLSSKTACDKSRSRLPEPKAHKDVTESMTDGGKRNSLDPVTLLDSLSEFCQQESKVAERLEATVTEAEKGPKNVEIQTQPNANHSPSPLIVPSCNKHSIKRKKSKHKHDKGRWKEKRNRKHLHSHDDAKSKVSLDCTEPSENLFDSEVLQMDNDTPDYLLKYMPICNHDQRQSYKQDFNSEYSEYRDLHAHIDSVTRQFMELDTQLKQLHHESHKYKTVRNQILQEYRKINKSNPSYNQDKLRCEYLHNKLAHIKKLISQYDHQQLQMDSAPN